MANPSSDNCRCAPARVPYPPAAVEAGTAIAPPAGNPARRPAAVHPGLLALYA